MLRAIRIWIQEPSERKRDGPGVPPISRWPVYLLIHFTLHQGQSHQHVVNNWEEDSFVWKLQAPQQNTRTSFSFGSHRTSLSIIPIFSFSESGHAGFISECLYNRSSRQLRNKRETREEGGGTIVRYWSPNTIIGGLIFPVVEHVWLGTLQPRSCSGVLLPNSDWASLCVCLCVCMQLTTRTCLCKSWFGFLRLQQVFLKEEDYHT